MTNQFFKDILLKIYHVRLLIFITGILFAMAMFFYAKTSTIVYTSRATVFPLNSSSDNSPSNAITSLLGLTDATKSFSPEASINIIELAKSRNTREAVAMERIPEMGNKTIAALVIENYNQNKSFFSASVNTPQNPAALAAAGAALLEEDMTPKLNKNGILEIAYNSTNLILAEKVNYIFIDKISNFYKELRIKKALLDYNFIVAKVDSLDKVINALDGKTIGISNKTLFVAPEKLQYQMPKENLSNEKNRILQQRTASTNNREDALWRLQKATPVIEILDKPVPPFDIIKPSAILYALMGLIGGMVLAIIVSISSISYRYVRNECKNFMLS